MSGRVLVIGGTRFLGRHVVSQALARGLDVTTLNRGVSGADDPGVTVVHGDRSDAAALADVASRGPFDAVVDTCGYVPRDVLASASALEAAGRRYVFVSSLSVHPGPLDSPVNEDTPVSECPPDAGPDDGDYGVLKSGCEAAVSSVFGDRALLVRPGLILGPLEDIGRLPWWLTRMSRGGDVLAPGVPGRPFQAVDARDLAAFCLDGGASGASGPMGVVSPPGRDTWGDLLVRAAEVTGGSARLVWAPDQLLLDAGVQPWTELPMWLPPDPDTDHFFDVRTDRAQAAGLSSRPLAETVADTWEWLRRLPEPPTPARDHGIDPDKEVAVIAALT